MYIFVINGGSSENAYINHPVYIINMNNNPIYILDYIAGFSFS